LTVSVILATASLALDFCALQLTFGRPTRNDPEIYSLTRGGVFFFAPIVRTLERPE
jgi:hypothetical protein